MIRKNKSGWMDFTKKSDSNEQIKPDFNEKL